MRPHFGKNCDLPGFTIRDPSSGKTYYWEHFGMMDQPSYAARTFSKLQLYTSFQIIPSIQLITTYETQEHPLNTETAEALCGSISYKSTRGQRDPAILAGFHILPAFIFPLPVSSKILGENARFFPQCPEITGET